MGFWATLRDLGLNIIAGQIPVVLGVLMLVFVATVALFRTGSLQRFERLRRGAAVEVAIFYISVFVAGGVVTVAAVLLSEFGKQPPPPTAAEIAGEIMKRLPAPPPSPTHLPTPTHPSLIVQAKEGVFPISVPSGSAGAYVVELNPGLADAARGWTRPLPLFAGVEESTWPENVPMGAQDPTPDMFVLCELTNHTDKALLDVAMIFPTFFYEPIRVAIKATRKPDGGLHLHLDTKGAGVTSGMIRVTQPNRSKNRFEGSAPGRLIKSVERIVVIPAIAPSRTAHVYVVNQSRLVAGYSVPAKATGQIAGSSGEVSIEVIRSKVSPLDSLQVFVLAPSAHPWKGVPGY